MAIPNILDSLKNPNALKGNPSLLPSQEKIQEELCVATNRPTTGSSVRQELIGTDNQATNDLESFKPRQGSREKPLLMKYPTEIGTAEVPHAMQFKIYWRWENKEFGEKAEKLKTEANAALGELTKEASVMTDNPEDLFPGMFPDAAADSMMGPPDPDDPSQDPYLQSVIQDAMKATIRGGIETKVKNATDRVQNIESDIVNAKEKGFGATEISKSDDFLGNRFNKQLDSGTLGAANAALKEIGKGIGGLQQRDPQYDQMVSIYLPICTRINGEDSFTYSDNDMSIATGALTAFNSIAAGNVMQPLVQAGTALAIKEADKINGLRGVITSLSGLVINPRLEKLFNQKEMRTFSFSWDFYPRNQQEVDTVKNIIETFRYHAHPSRQGNEQDPQIMLRVPAEFTVKFLSSIGGSQGKGFVENEYIPKISRCVLTAISVDYTPNGVFSTFENNSPVAYSLTLSFSEIAQITREDVERGY